MNLPFNLIANLSCVIHILEAVLYDDYRQTAEKLGAWATQLLSFIGSILFTAALNLTSFDGLLSAQILHHWGLCFSRNLKL